MTQEYILLWDYRTVLDLVRPPWEKLLWYSQTTCHVESTGQLRRWGPIVTPSPHVRRTSNSIHSPIFNVKKYCRYCRAITGSAILMMRTIHYLPCCNFSSPVLKINIAICLDDKYRHFSLLEDYLHLIVFTSFVLAFYTARAAHWQLLFFLSDTFTSADAL